MVNQFTENNYRATIIPNKVPDELYFLADCDRYAEKHYGTYFGYRLRYIEKLDLGCNWCGIFDFNNEADAIAFEKWANDRQNGIL